MFVQGDLEKRMHEWRVLSEQAGYRFALDFLVKYIDVSGELDALVAFSEGTLDDCSHMFADVLSDAQDAGLFNVVFYGEAQNLLVAGAFFDGVKRCVLENKRLILSRDKKALSKKRSTGGSFS